MLGTLVPQGLQSGHLTTHVGTLMWMAPEVLAGGQYGPAADMFSFGVVLWETATHCLPQYDLEDVTASELLALLRTGVRLDRPLGCPAGYEELMAQCWSLVAAARPSFSALLSHPLFVGFNQGERKESVA
jgi:LRR receptor-like serine/threonine-protein kinase FLS2